MDVVKQTMIVKEKELVINIYFVKEKVDVILSKKINAISLKAQIYLVQCDVEVIWNAKENDFVIQIIFVKDRINVRIWQEKKLV